VTDKLTRWNATDHIKTPEAQVLYLDACIEDCGEDSAVMIQVLRDIAHAQGIEDLIAVAGLDPDSLSDGCELTLESFIKVAYVLGFQIGASRR